MQSASEGAGPAAAPPPPPSPLSGAYLLILVAEPHTDAHKQDILRKVAKGFLSWDMESCHVALDKELQAIISQAPEGEEAKNGERLIQFASENLVTEVLINPQLNTLIQCVRNLLSSFTKHRHIIHAGYTFAGNGSWIVQDGTFSLADLIDAFQEVEVQRVLRAYELSVTVDIHCAPEGEWSTARMRRETFSKLCRVRVNPDDSPSPAENINQFVDFLAPFIQPASVDQLLEPSDVVGNIRFSHPTLYVFPGGQGDAALFGINGFNMLIDGGFSRKACFWDFARHLDRLDAVLMTRINNSNINGIASVMRRKTSSQVYPQIGHFFCNLQDRKQPCTPEEEKMRDSLLVSLLDEGQEIVQNLRHLQMKPHICVRDSVLEPINLYHKVGHGKLDMYVISPAKDSKELKEFLSKWHSHDISLFSSSSKKPGDKDISFPLQNLVSICALLVWQPANPEDTITRILFPGSTPQQKIFEGLEKLRCLEFMKQPVCTSKSMSPSSSTTGISSKVSRVKSSPAVIDKLLPGEGLSKPVSKITHQTEPIAKQNVAKTATIPVSGAGEFKPKLPATSKPVKPKIEKLKSDNKTDTDKNIEIESELISKQDKPIIISDLSKDYESSKMKTEKQKPESKPKKVDAKVSSKLSEKKTKSSSIEKKDSVKSSPTTPKKSLDTKVNGVAAKSEIIKSTSKVSNKTKTSPSATPAKSTKEENNRKVVESKVRAAAASKTNSGKLPKREESLPKQKNEKKLSKKSSSSPVRVTSKQLSPVKGTIKTVSKPKKDQTKSKPEHEKGIIADSSTVSTPSTVDAEIGITKEIKVDAKDSQLENVQHDIEDKPKDKENTVAAKLDNLNGSKIIIEPTVSKHETRQLDPGDKDFSEKEEDDDILIIEKVELEQYGDDSTQDQESLESHVPDETEDEIQKHLRDEAESEKKKEDVPRVDDNEAQEKENSVFEIREVENNEFVTTDSNVHSLPVKLDINIDQNTLADTILSPENREQIEEEVQEIITSATDFVTKSKLEQSKESSELSAECMGSDEQKTSAETKDLSSVDKVNVISDKNFTDDDNKHDDTKDKSRELGEARFGAEESQPDEKFSTTVESGATTAPTLPEDERIPLDEIKEGVEEKYDKEDIKEKDAGVVQGRLEQPTTLPQVSVISGGQFETQASHVIVRDIVKTPDEVADLPVHEEVDGLYEDDNFIREGQKNKEEILNIVSCKKDTDGNLKQLTTADSSGLDLNDKLNDAVKDIEMQAMSVEAIDTVLADTKIDKDECQEPQFLRNPIEVTELKADSKIEPELNNIDSESDLVLEDIKCDTIDHVSNVDQEGIVLPMEKVLAAEDLIHSTLKAPEVAELVLVTPDSAPDSPLHLGVNTDGAEKHTENEQNEFEGIPQAQIDVLHANIEGHEPEKQLELVGEIIEGSNVGSDGIGDQNKSAFINGIGNQTIGHETTADKYIVKGSDDPISLFSLGDNETNEEVEPDNNVPCNTTDANTDLDKLNINKPKTPPASPVLFGMENDPVHDNIDISKEIIKDNGHLKETDTAIIKLDIKHGYELQDLPGTNQESQIFSEIKDPNEPAKVTVGEYEPGITETDYGSDKETHDAIESVIDSQDVQIYKNQESFKSSSEEQVTFKDDSKMGDVDLTQKSPSTKDSKLNGEQIPLSPAKAPVLSEDSYENKIVNETKQLEEKLVTSKTVSQETSVESDKAPCEAKIMSDEHDTPDSIIPEPSGTYERIITKDSELSLENNESPKSVDPVTSGNLENNQALTDINLILKKQDTPKSISPVASEPLDDIRSLQGSKPVTQNQGSPKSISPIPSERRDERQSLKDARSFEDKNDTPKSISPVPSDNIDDIPPLKDTNLINEKEDTPKSMSPVSSVIKDESQALNEAKSLDEKHDTPKSISPGPSEIIDASQVIKDAKVITEKQDTPKSISPTPSEMIDESQPLKDAKSLEDKHDTPKSISPLPSDNNDEIPSLNDTNVTSEKQDTPKSISPVSIVRKYEIQAFNEAKLLDEKHDTPKCISPGPSEDIDASQVIKDAKVDTEKQDRPKSISPLPCESKDESQSSNDVKSLEDKHDTPKSISPVPSDIIDEIPPLKDKNVITEKQGTPNSVSPVSSVRKDEHQAYNEAKSLDEKHDTPKSISPGPSEKNDESQVIKDAKVDTEKQNTPKSISPLPSERKDESQSSTNVKSLEDKHVTPKSISLLPSDNIDEIAPLKCSNEINEKQDTPKCASPVFIERKDENQAFNEDKSLDEKHDTPKCKSPGPSEDIDASQVIKDAKVDTEKQDTPKSISPIPSDRKDESQSSNDVKSSDNKQDTPKSISPVRSDNIDEIPPLNDTNVISEKQDTPKSISPVSIVRKDEIQTFNEVKSLDEKHDTPKTISPGPSEIVDESQLIEDAKVFTEKQDTPKSISPILSERKDESQSLDDKHDTPKSMSPVPSDNIDEHPPLKYFNEITEKQETPKSISPVSSVKKDESQALNEAKSEEEKHDTLKSISLEPSENIDESQVIKDAKVVTEKQDTPKSISPILSERKDESQSLDDKHDTPKSMSPVPSDNIDEDPPLKDFNEITEKEETTKSISPVSSVKKDESQKLNEAKSGEEKHDTPKSISLGPSENIDESQVIKDANVVAEKEETPKSISPIPSERKDESQSLKDLQSLEDKHDTPKSISPVPSDNIDEIPQLKDTIVITDKQGTPKSVIAEPSVKKDESQELKEIKPLEDKHDSLKNISPVPGENIDESQALIYTKEMTEKQDTPLSTSTLPSESKHESQTTQETKPLEDKHDLLKSITPIPIENIDEKQVIDDTKVVKDKQDTPKSYSSLPIETVDESRAQKETKVTTGKDEIPISISPVPSEKEDGNKESKLSEEKHDSPISISPEQIEKGDDIPAFEDTKVITEKHDKTQSISPVSSEKTDQPQASRESASLEDQRDTPKRISPVPSENGDDSPALKDNGSVTENKESPKSISPLPRERGGEIQESKEFTFLEEKLDTPKSISPVSSEKYDGSQTSKDERITDKYDTPQSSTLLLSDMIDENQASNETKLFEEKRDSPKSNVASAIEKGDDSPTHKDTEEITKQPDTTKSVSASSSEKGDNRETKSLEDKHGTPKSVSPVSSEQVDDSFSQKDITIKETHKTPQSSSPVSSEMSGEVKAGNEATFLEENPDGCKSVSPVLDDQADGNKIKGTTSTEEKHDTPQTFSPLPSQKSDQSQAPEETQTEPKSIEVILDTQTNVISVPSEKDNEMKLLYNIKSLEEKQDIQKSTSPIPSQKSDANIPKERIASEEAHAIPQCLSPVRNEQAEENQIASDTTLDRKHDTPNSIGSVLGEKSYEKEVPKESKSLEEKIEIAESLSLSPNDKGDESQSKVTKVFEEKYVDSERVSPVSSGKGNENQEQNHINNVEEKHITSRSLSPILSEMCDESQRVNELQAGEEKHVIPGVSSGTDGGSPAPSAMDVEQFGLSSTLDQSLLTDELKLIEKDHVDNIPKSISSVLSDTAGGNKVPKQSVLLEGKHDTPKGVIPEVNETEHKISTEETSLGETHITLKGKCPVQNEKDDKHHGLKESKPLEISHDSLSSSSPVADVLVDKKTPKETTPSEETHDALQHVRKSQTEELHESPSGSNSLTKILETQQEHVSSDGQLETPSGKTDCEVQGKESGQSTNIASIREEDIDQSEGITTEKSETELPEKCNVELSEESSKSSKQGIDEIGEHICKFDSSAKKLQVCGIHESDNKSIEDSLRNALTPEKVPVLTSSTMESNSNLENEYFSKEKRGSESKDQTNSFYTTTESTYASQETPLPARELSTTLEVNDIELVTNAVIENTLESKDIKTAESLNIESSSIVPSSTFVINSKDSELNTATSQTSYDEREDRSSSVHRMLVTRSSEDGGTETELCSSSVTQIVGNSNDKQLGNVSHEIGEDLGKNKYTDEISTTNLVSSYEDLSLADATNTVRHTEIDSKSTKKDSEKSAETTSPINTCNADDAILKLSGDPVAKLQQESSKIQTIKPTETAMSGPHSYQLKKDIADSARSGTPASDLMSDREIDTGGPSTPHSDISSGQVSRVATHTWESEGRHADSDDDLPCSPMSAASHAAHSPPQFDFDVHQHVKEGFYEEASKPIDLLPSAMTSSLYGSLPKEDPLDEFSKHLPTSGDGQMYSSMYVSKYGDEDHEESSKRYLADSKGQFEAMFSLKKDDIDFETAVKEHISTRGEDLTTQFTNGSKDTTVNGKQPPSTNGLGKQPYVNGKGSQPESLEYQDTTQSITASTSGASQKPIASKPVPTEPSSGAKPSADDKKDPIEGWGKPLGLPPPPKSLIESPLSRSTLTLVWNPADEWGIPLGLPSPAPPTVKKDSMNGEIDLEITPSSNKTTPKKVARRNAENKSASNTQVGKEASNKTKHPESPVKRGSNKESRAKPVSPVYMDLTYVPHHGNSHYTNVEFFKRVRARYYVFSGTEPSREVFNALLEAKQTWEDKDLEVTIIPTYDTDTLGYWVAENEDILTKHKIDLSPSASRCTINLQDHETSCSAYRLEF